MLLEVNNNVKKIYTMQIFFRLFLVFVRKHTEHVSLLLFWVSILCKQILFLLCNEIETFGKSVFCLKFRFSCYLKITVIYSLTFVFSNKLSKLSEVTLNMFPHRKYYLEDIICRYGKKLIPKYILRQIKYCAIENVLIAL